MSGYKRILAAVDLSGDSALVTEKALAFAQQHGAELHLVHTMEPMVPGYVVEVTSIDIAGLQAEAEKYARKALGEIGARVGVPAARLHTILGHAAYEIRTLAKAISADLVVMGGHGKHGFELLLGSTSSGVTHGISCDLLIVRIPNDAAPRAKM